MVDGMIVDRKAFDAAWEAVGWDNQNPQATKAQERFVAAYETAKLAALPADKVEWVARVICIDFGHDPDSPTQDVYCKDDPDCIYPWAGYRRAAQAAIAAMPQPVEVSRTEIIDELFKVPSPPVPISSQTMYEVLTALRAAGYRIVKGEAS